MAGILFDTPPGADLDLEETRNDWKKGLKRAIEIDSPPTQFFVSFCVIRVDLCWLCQLCRLCWLCRLCQFTKILCRNPFIHSDLCVVCVILWRVCQFTSFVSLWDKSISIATPFPLFSTILGFFLWTHLHISYYHYLGTAPEHFQLPQVEVGYFCRVYKLMKKTEDRKYAVFTHDSPLLIPIHNIRDLRLTPINHGTNCTLHHPYSQWWGCLSGAFGLSSSLLSYVS